MTTPEALAKQRAKRAVARQALQAKRLADYAERVAMPLTRKVAHAICRSVYGRCPCERPGVDPCATMTSAALTVIRLVRQGETP